MTITKAVCILAGAVFLTACSSTKVVLIPDADGKVGQVSVTTEGGEQLLTREGESTEVVDASQAPKAPVILEQSRINSVFGATLASEPDPPIRHILYFSFDSIELKPGSGDTIAAIHKDILGRQSCDISVIGHTDRTGDDTYNRRLSLQRSENIIRKLTNMGIEPNCMRSEYYGENDPKIKTADGKAEPENRRVEVEIR